MFDSFVPLGLRRSTTMRMQTRLIAIVALLLCFSGRAVGAPGLSVTGKVVDPAVRPVSDATVVVYHAGVLKGYSTLCPNCYRDCGERTKSDASGTYTINNLQPGLWFE